uniref:Uncharacterized protein n=1 Tax=Candidatus Kentrum sp. LFY TaxID=2126342 RepID=A0A450U7G2_9GAMM|nr:MAG: hypothetical protein BECKLFY1418B_GA0070995_100762 [Candidatus Kentron sp. LFY]
MKLFTWDGVHTILIYPTDDVLFGFIFLFGKRTMSIPIAKDRDLWKDKITHPQVYVICQPLGKFVGPISLGDFPAHRTGDAPISELEEIEKKHFDPSTLPKITQV